MLPMTDKQKAAYKDTGDHRGPWQSVSLSAKNSYSMGIYPLEPPSGRIIDGPPAGSYCRISKEKLCELDADDRIYWGKEGSGIPRRKVFLSELRNKGIVPQTL